MKSFNKGFTLIELLVVITIIGILAVGGISIFTTQLQKARDGTRFQDIKQYQTATEQYRSDENDYPDYAGYTGSIKKYVSVITQDPKHMQLNCVWTGNDAGKIYCGYHYENSNDANGVAKSAYKLWIAVENEGNLKNFAAEAVDGGDNESLYEIYAGWSGGLIPVTVTKSVTDVSNLITR